MNVMCLNLVIVIIKETGRRRHASTKRRRLMYNADNL